VITSKGAIIGPEHRFGTYHGDGALAIGSIHLIASTHQTERSLTVIDWLNEHEMGHTRGRPYRTMAQRKIERWHRPMKNQVLLENYYRPSGTHRFVHRLLQH
jgi:hypothetical protein